MTEPEAPKIYYCPTAGEVEQHPGGGFDVCCDRPELHRAIKWTDLWGIDPNYTKDADEEPTLTAAEVKVLTETGTKVAYELGRKDALEEVAREMGVDRWDDEPRKYVTVQIDWDTYNMLQEALGAVSDASSGVPGHQEVSEAVRSPQDRCGHPTCPCNADALDEPT